MHQTDVTTALFIFLWCTRTRSCKGSLHRRQYFRPCCPLFQFHRHKYLGHPLPPPDTESCSGAATALMHHIIPILFFLSLCSSVLQFFGKYPAMDVRPLLPEIPSLQKFPVQCTNLHSTCYTSHNTCKQLTFICR